ncbi:MAG TPA: phosphatase domain-containing protein [Lacisediminihabitans sp.]|uniref:App1 family protein n=1 Tax=Lacisediminihabitans sp. TaxID=2787631 RepID=UPI002ED94AC8
MAKPRAASSETPEQQPIVHFAARVEDRLHEFREKRARRRGYLPMVIPYTSYGAPEWARILCRILLSKPEADNDIARKKIRGWRSFTSVTVNDVPVTISVGGLDRVVMADRGGVVDTVIPIRLEPGWHTVTITTEHAEAIEAPLFVMDPAMDVGIISDVDDTVMVTALPRPLLAAWNTFVLDEHARRPVPGMAVLYERLSRAHSGAPVFYLSTGAWNVAPTLSRFLSRNLYPAGPLLLTDWGPTHDRWFRSGKAHKVESLRRLAREFPTVHWLLVGDDGQHDEEIYGEFSTSHPDNVAAIAIRQLSNSEAVLAGGRSRTEEPADRRIPWVYAPDGAGLAERFVELGLL